MTNEAHTKATNDPRPAERIEAEEERMRAHVAACEAIEEQATDEVEEHGLATLLVAGLGASQPMNPMFALLDDIEAGLELLARARGLPAERASMYADRLMFKVQAAHELYRREWLASRRRETD